MKKISVILLVLMLALLVSACTRSASTAPVTTPQTIESFKTPLPVDQQILNATMTAQAIMKEFNQPTQMVTNPAGTTVAITPLPPTDIPVGTPTPTSLPPTPMMTRPTSWTVQGGESVYCLARRFDVNPADMLALNQLYEGSMLSIGDVLQVPQSGSWPSESRQLLAHPDIWTVSPGETVYGIACEYGDIYPEQIIAVNGLKAPYDLTGIKTLQIP